MFSSIRKIMYNPTHYSLQTSYREPSALANTLRVADRISYYREFCKCHFYITVAASIAFVSITRTIPPIYVLIAFSLSGITWAIMRLDSGEYEAKAKLIIERFKEQEIERQIW